MIKDKFVNAQQMAADFPETFEAPPYSDFQDLEEGDFVKVCANDERFWCRIVEIDHDDQTIVGSVSNELICNVWPVDHLLEFNFENIYSILKK